MKNKNNNLTTSFQIKTNKTLIPLKNDSSYYPREQLSLSPKINDLYENAIINKALIS